MRASSTATRRASSVPVVSRFMAATNASRATGSVRDMIDPGLGGRTYAPSRQALACRCRIEQYSMGRAYGPPTTVESTFRDTRVERRGDMEDEHGMIPMG